MPEPSTTSVAPEHAHAVFRVHGMDCAEEVGALRRELQPIAGVAELHFDLLDEKLTVDFDPAHLDPPRIEQAIARTGMRAESWAPAPPESAGPRWNARALLCLASGVLLIAGAVAHRAASGSWTEVLGARPPAVAAALYLLSILMGARYVAPKALAAARRLRPDMNLLMLVAVAGALGIGEWLEAASVTFLFALSLLLESWSVGRARRAVAALLDLAPTEATVLHAPGQGFATCESDPCRAHEHPEVHHEHRVPVAELHPGAIVLVRPGERIPVDGVVVRGDSHVNQAPITGEPMPVRKQPDAALYSGTINGEGALEMRATSTAERSTLAQIVRLVGEARKHRSHSERFVERFAAIYTPAVMGLALLSFVLRPALTGAGWSEALYHSLVLLVIACPCALVISTPVSVVCALASAARNGVLIKGGRFVEAPAHVRCVALDKTGTLTEGRATVREVLPLNEHSERDLLEIAAAVEAKSDHPLARAIAAHAREKGVHPQPAEDYQALRGKGAEARVGEKRYWIGSHRLLSERGHETPELAASLARLAEEECSSVVLLGSENHVCGMFALGDRPRAGARAAIAALHEGGVEKVVMLSGDNQATAAHIAESLGIDEYRAELLPQDKAEAVAALGKEHGAIAMVGDGVNDAPALARADIAVALGGAGSDAAIETADVVILSDDLAQLPWLFAHSRRALGVIRQNIYAALAVKAAFVGLAFAGWSTLWMAVAADMGVSLAVVANAMRLLRAGRPAIRET